LSTVSRYVNKKGLCVIQEGAKRWDYASLRGSRKVGLCVIKGGAERWDYVSLRGKQKGGIMRH